jgi:cytochrome oxidase Cu insertion factor (SCO1/SenC/PrrC family)
MSGSKLSNPAAKNELSDSPLAMTVHDMPRLGDVAHADAQRTRVGRWKMLAMLLICASPVIASYFTYYVVRPDGRRNYGELIEPQKDMPQATAKNLQGESVTLSSLQGQWLLVNVSSGACAERCQQNLYFQRQLREILGRDKDRLDRVWLITDDAPVADTLLPALNMAHVLRLDKAIVQSWISPATGQDLQDHLYVVDPMGNFMMRFPANMDVASASKAKRDLERLLKASASWDKAGR